MWRAARERERVAELERIRGERMRIRMLTIYNWEGAGLGRHGEELLDLLPVVELE